MPLVEMYFAFGELTDKQKADPERSQNYSSRNQKCLNTTIFIHELPEANWMIDRLTLTELFAKIKAEKK